MSVLPAFVMLFLTLVVISAVLQIALVLRWSYLERPHRSVLKASTLCAAIVQCRTYLSSGVAVRYSARQAHNLPATGRALEDDSIRLFEHSA